MVKKYISDQTEAPLYVFIIVNQFEKGITRKFIIYAYKEFKKSPM